MSLLGLPGCALTQKATPTDVRYFSPEPLSGATSVTPMPIALGSRSEKALDLRLGRVTAAADIRERIVYRDSKYEVGFYEDRMWTERPDAYLRRALSQKLFEEQGLRSVIAGAAPVLDVELTSFEEVRKPQHIAVVRITFALRDDHVVRRSQTFTVQRPIPETDKAESASAIAAALGEGLLSAVAQISENVLADLARPPELPAATARNAR
jgi:cholesterol transport system auxiliary component